MLSIFLASLLASAAGPWFYIVVGLVVLLVCVLRAGSSDPTQAPWPFGLQWIRLGGYVANGLGNNTTPDPVFKWIAPYDCYVRVVRESIIQTGSIALPDLITITTIDATAKTVVAQVADGLVLDSVKQTLHADIINFKIVAGNGILVSCDTSQATEAGYLVFDIGIEPAYQCVATGRP